MTYCDAVSDILDKPSCVLERPVGAPTRMHISGICKTGVGEVLADRVELGVA